MSAVVTEKTKTIRDGAFGHARALVCRECGHEVELGPSYACPECFGPLEVGYDDEARGRVTRAQIEAGPPNIWRYKALLPVPYDIETSPNTEPGFTRLLRAHNLGSASSASTRCGSRTTPPTRPTPSRTGWWPAR